MVPCSFRISRCSLSSRRANWPLRLSGYLDFAMVSTALSQDWTSWENPYLREAAWTDVSVGAYYAIPVLRAYGIGVAEGTSATTFSPDQAATRGEFANRSNPR